MLEKKIPNTSNLIKTVIIKFWDQDFMKKQLDRLTPVELRDYWENEAIDFTPWLAKEKNIALLGESIGIELEVVGVERSAGDFKVDILAQDSDRERYVVIENQLGKTDHAHLGQLLAYASAYDASAIVWIAKEIRDEHRRALDWLNENASDIAFFGIEIELWKIGESKAAPHFRLVSQPNDWSRTVNVTNSAEEVGLSGTKLLRKEFWSEFRDYMKENNTFLSLRTPSHRQWYPIAVGRTKFHISLTIKLRKAEIGCELYIRPPESKKAFAVLYDEKEQIESELNAELEWKELPDKGASRIVQYHPSNIEDKSTWPGLFSWFKERAEAFHGTFSERVCNLELED